MIKIGIPIGVRGDCEASFARVKDMGFSCCQLNADPFSMNDDVIDVVIRAREKYGVETESFWCGLRGPQVWDFYEGQLTLGLVPSAFRDGRMQDLLEASRVCAKLGIKDIITHCGYIPENPLSETYHEVVATLRHIAAVYKRAGQYFCFETGQETPITLLRVIEDVGTGNLGINLDPANLLMYGKANPVDALDVFGKYVRCLHAKDGEYPTDGRNLGVEKAIGKGRADFPAMIAKLKKLHFEGAFIIEREIPEGPEQSRDILEAKAYLEQLTS